MDKKINTCKVKPDNFIELKTNLTLGEAFEYYDNKQKLEKIRYICSFLKRVLKVEDAANAKFTKLNTIERSIMEIEFILKDTDNGI